MENNFKKLVQVGFIASLSFSVKSYAFLLDLQGVETIKDSAEILANAIENFPSRSVAIALIGLLAASNGIFFLTKGLIDIVTHENEKDIRGKAQFWIGIFLTAIGSTLALYSVNISYFIP